MVAKTLVGAAGNGAEGMVAVANVMQGALRKLHPAHLQSVVSNKVHEIVFKQASTVPIIPNEWDI